MAVWSSPLTTELSPAAKDSLLLRRVLRLLDMAAVATGWFTALVVPDGIRPLSVGHATRLAATGVLVVLVSEAILASQGLYLSRVCSVKTVQIARLTRAALASAMVAVAGGRVFGVDVSPSEATTGLLITLALLVVLRDCFGSWLQANRRTGRFTRSIIVVGDNDEALDVCRLVRENPECGYRVSGVVGDAGRVRDAGFAVAWLGPLDRTLAAVEESAATGVIIATSAVPLDRLNRLVRDLLKERIHVQLSNGLRGFDHHRVRLQPVAHEPLLYLEQSTLSRSQAALKRTLDVLVATACLVVSAPVLAAAAVAIKLDDGGPVLFRQQRVGRGGKAFTIYKLRTMATDAEQRVRQLRQLNERNGPLFKMSDDPRVTRVGRFLRAASIDELPQLYNVLAGAMSLVGPRPALPEEVAQFDDELLARQDVLPGITGLWQVEARDNPSFLAYQRLDLFYVENWSIALDLVILLSTAHVVLLRAFLAALPGRAHPLPEQAITGES